MTAFEDCGVTLRRMCQSLETLVLAPRGHSLTFEVTGDSAGLTVGGHIARCLAFVVAELVMNAAKQGFPPAVCGRIIVGLTRTGDRITCTVRDDRSSIHAADPGAASSGMLLAQRLAQQAGGNCRWFFSPTGAEARVTLPIASREGGATFIPAIQPAIKEELLTDL
jgi:two-component sensor histidine kinase